MERIGKLKICDICGKTVFLKKTGRKSTDGGYGTSYDTYEEAQDWSYKTDVGDMCPDCSTAYTSMIEYFKKRMGKITDGETEEREREA